LANTKSAKKDIRVNTERRARNRSVKSLCRSSITKAEKLLAGGDIEGAKTAVGSAVRTLDRAAEKGIIHPNNAARRKSRLMDKLNKTVPPVAGVAKT